jgi:preprotein translocase subunit SecD
MNRYPVWKYAIIVIALLMGAIYTLPNFFGEAPAVQVSSGKVTVKVDGTTQARVEQALQAAGIKPEAITLEANSVKVRLDSGDTQLRAKDAIRKPWCPILRIPPMWWR